MTDSGLVCALPDRAAAAEIRKYQDAVIIREILQTAHTIAMVCAVWRIPRMVMAS